MSRSPVYSKIFVKRRETKRCREKRNRNCTNFLTDVLMQFYWDDVTNQDGTMSVYSETSFVKVREAKTVFHKGEIIEIVQIADRFADAIFMG